MNDETEIRPARSEDVEAIVALQRLIHAEHMSADALRWTTATPIDSVYPTWIGEIIGKTRDGIALVAVDGTEVVGYLVAEHEPEATKHWSPESIYFHDLFVSPTHRRGGVARRLVERLFAWRDAKHPMLPIRLTTAASNDAARTFFKRFGFRPATVDLIEDVQSERSSID